MDKGKKRERNVNFSREETEKLIYIVEKYKNIIQNKKSDAVTWQLKEKTWKAVEKEYNCSGTGPFRDAKHLKIKFEAIKRDIRKKYSALRGELCKTGGSANQITVSLTPVEEKIIQKILLSVEEDESICDSDRPDVAETDMKEELIVLPESIDSTEKLLDPLSGTYTDECKTKEQRPFDKLVEGKLEIVQIQKTIIEKELQEKEIKRQMVEMEMKHRKELYELEKEERLLKIRMLKCELENKKKFEI